MLSRKDYEKKLREEQEATAHVFQDFITTFQGSSGPPNKTFVKSGILYPENGHSINETCELYSPKPRVKTKDTMIQSAIECARILKNSKIEKSKKQPKPTSNLELLKEELKMRHFERDEKNKCKEEGAISDNYFCEGDPNSTNLFVANLNSKITENDLMKLFGTYGPLASVKIMWPRGEERFRNTNCGFVAFMSRKDAERALNYLKHREDMRVGWGKCVDIPAHPIYIPESLLKLYLPPPYTGLPFNAQPLDPVYDTPKDEHEMQELLKNSVVKVTLPLDKKVLMTVHRVIEFVIREGPLFEAYIMNKEIDNPDYYFLFDNRNPVHIYYRWKLYSIQFGEGLKSWSLQPFRMFKNGSVWIPPVAPCYTNGMPDELFNVHKKIDNCRLSDAQVSRMVSLIRNLTLSKISIAEAMVFCLKHSGAMIDIIELLLDSLDSPTCDPLKKIARLYLLSDILYNCNIKKITLTQDGDTLISESLINIFQGMKSLHDNFKCQYDKEAFKTRILKVIRSWDIWKLFPITFIYELEAIILESEEQNDGDEEDSSNDEPLDGASLIKRSIKCKSSECHLPSEDYKKNDVYKKPEGFVPSKWDSVDPSEVEAQAMSSKKLYELEIEKQINNESSEESAHDKTKKKKNKKISSKDIKDKSSSKISSKWDSDDEGRKSVSRKENRNEKKHKELTPKQMKKIDYLIKKYQEDIQNGFRELKKGYTIKQQVCRYRRHLIKDMEENSSFE